MDELGFKIGFYSTIIGAGVNMGYGYTAVQLIEAWQRKMHPVWWSDDEAPIAFSFVQPHGYEYTNPNRINIGYTPWESTYVPEAWLYYMDKMTEIWTTSEACKQWYLDAGVTRPIRVLHHGINSEHWTPKLRTKTIEEPFRFLHVGAESKRKGAKNAYDVFRTLYANRKDVILVLKGEPQFQIEIDNVHVIDGNLLLEDLVRLYHKCHALIYPGNGEGFGLIPFQGAATGMPTFTTNWGGSKDYMQYCWPIQSKGLIDCDYEPHTGGQWADPNLENLQYYMEQVVQHYDYYSTVAYQRALRMMPEWSWDNIAAQSLGWFEDLIESH